MTSGKLGEGISDGMPDGKSDGMLGGVNPDGIAGIVEGDNPDGMPDGRPDGMLGDGMPDGILAGMLGDGIPAGKIDIFCAALNLHTNKTTANTKTVNILRSILELCRWNSFKNCQSLQ